MEVLKETQIVWIQEIGDVSYEEIIGSSHIDSCPVFLVANRLRMEKEDGGLHDSYHHPDNAISRVPDVFG